MGLAQPRKRIKIAHDPRNLTWSQSETSYGQRLMQQQGWQAGQSLGARNTTSNTADDEDRLAASRIGILYKDDTLGLGAQLKSKDPTLQRTGLDAFQGLLGRLNSKDAEQLKQVERKIEDKKLAMFAQGRWGGMVFVPGGILVQGDEYKSKKEMKEKEKTKEQLQYEEAVTGSEDTDAAQLRKRKEEKKARKEERKLRKATRETKKAEMESERDDKTSDSVSTKKKQKVKKSKTLHEHKKQATPPDEPLPRTDTKEPIDVSQSKSTPISKCTFQTPRTMTPEIQHLSAGSNTPRTAQSTPEPTRNGRHLLRGKNIQAKRMAFSDSKGLDEIFMRQSPKIAS